MLLSLAFAGQWAAALILPAYYLADATVTLGRRTLRGEKVWRPHRDHFYQRAAAASLGHRAMAGLVAGTGAVLVGLAVLAGAGFPGAALLAAASLVAGVLVRLERVAGKTGSGQRS